MKILFYTTLFLLLILVVAAAILLLTFDINTYKSDIVRLLSQKIGYPTRINSMELSFKNGIALRANGFSLEGEAKSQGSAFRLQADKIFLTVAIPPLFQRELLIKEIFVESPKFVYKANTSIASTPNANVPDAKKGASQKEAAKKKSAYLAVWSLAQFEISKVIISKGTFTYEEEDRTAPTALLVQNVNLEMSDLSFGRPIRFRGDADFELGSQKKLTVEGTFSYRDQTVRFDANLDRSLKLSGEGTNLFQIPLLRGDLSIQNLDLASFYTPEQKKEEYLSGSLSGTISLNASGRNGAELQKSLSGAGKLEVAPGALKNRNLLRENLEKITQIPGIGLLFTVDLGPRFDALLGDRDTAFSRLETNVRVEQRNVLVDSLVLEHPDYGVSLKGTCSLERSVNLAGILVIGTPLSNAMIKKVHELVLIVDETGQMRIPFIYRGKFPRAVLMPNLGALAQKTIENIGTELISQALDSLLKPKEAKPT